MISSVENRPGLENHHQNRTVAVDVNDIGLRRIAVAHAGDVADVDHRAVHGLDRQVAEFFHLQGRVVELDVVFEIADLLGADRRDQVLRGQCVGYVLSRKPAGLQRRRIEIDLHLALLAAERIRDRGAGHRDQRRTQLIDADVGEILFGKAFA